MPRRVISLDVSRKSLGINDPLNTSVVVDLLALTFDKTQDDVCEPEQDVSGPSRIPETQRNIEMKIVSTEAKGFFAAKILMAIALLGFSFVPEPALAVDKWTCDCQPSSIGACTCTGQYTREIKPWVTIYFEGTCSAKVTNIGRPIVPLLKQGGGKNIICSSGSNFYAGDDPSKMGCTNLGTKKSTLSAEISCNSTEY